MTTRSLFTVLGTAGCLWLTAACDHERNRRGSQSKLPRESRVGETVESSEHRSAISAAVRVAPTEPNVKPGTVMILASSIDKLPVLWSNWDWIGGFMESLGLSNNESTRLRSEITKLYDRLREDQGRSVKNHKFILNEKVRVPGLPRMFIEAEAEAMAFSATTPFATSDLIKAIATHQAVTEFGSGFSVALVESDIIELEDMRHGISGPRRYLKIERSGAKGRVPMLMDTFPEPGSRYDFLKPNNPSK
jgi:hypothetical protein